MSHKPRVSIIIDNYNYAPYLATAIESALAQIYQNIEVIVVDDGSTDDSTIVAQRYQERVILINKSNGGQASALNAGFAHATGHIVMFLDSDDVLLPHTAEQVVTALEENPAVVKVQYRMEVIDKAGQTTGQVKPSAHIPLAQGNLLRHVLAFPGDLAWAATSGNAFPATILQRILPIPERDFRNFADFYLSYIPCLYGNVLFLDMIGAQYRIHDRNSHEPTTLDVRYSRRSIEYMRMTHQYLRRRAREARICSPYIEAEDLLSVSYVAHRAISYRLDMAGHPINDDTLRHLFGLALEAIHRRFDVSASMKGVYLLWFMVMLLAPRRIAEIAAEKFVLSGRREVFNRGLALLHRQHSTRP